MSFWSNLKAALSGGSAKTGASTTGDPDGLMMYFRCNNCGSKVAVRLNKRNDLSRDEDGPGALFVSKEIMDDKCFRLMRAELWFDNNYVMVTGDVTGGTIISAEEYASDAPQED